MTIKASKTVLMCVMVAIGGLLFYLVSSGILFDQHKLESLILSYGALAPLVFIGLQIVQVVVPVIPGGVSSAVGVVLFGPKVGFFLNFIGLMIGVTIAFWLARIYGKAFILRFVKEKTFNKYIKWVECGKVFDILFFLALLLPGLPDDVLCMIAGLTKLKFSRYLLYNALAKGISLTLYSYGINELMQLVSTII